MFVLITKSKNNDREVIAGFGNFNELQNFAKINRISGFIYSLNREGKASVKLAKV